MSAAPFRCRLVVMAKAPVAGAAKTRLARDIGVGAATGFARHAGHASLLRLARDPRWETIVAVAPDTAVALPIWPRGVRTMAQGGGDLGARMQGLIARMPRGPVVIVGSDIPAIRASHVARAFRLLGSADAVFGPAGDGGYWLVGMKRRPRCAAPFCNVRWSSPYALADTLANLSGLKVSFTATLHDVDDAAGLSRNAGHIGRVIIAASGDMLEPFELASSFTRSSLTRDRDLL